MSRAGVSVVGTSDTPVPSQDGEVPTRPDPISLGTGPAQEVRGGKAVVGGPGSGWRVGVEIHEERTVDTSPEVGRRLHTNTPNGLYYELRTFSSHVSEGLGRCFSIVIFCLSCTPGTSNCRGRVWLASSASGGVWVNSLQS